MRLTVASQGLENQTLWKSIHLMREHTDILAPAGKSCAYEATEKTDKKQKQHNHKVKVR